MTETVRAIRVRIPGAPDLALTPNRRNRWGGARPGARAAKQARADAWKAARAVRNELGLFGTGPIFAGPVRVAVEIGWPRGQRKLDRDNAEATCKSALDGILVDARFVADDRAVQEIDVTQVRDATGPGWVLVTVTAAG